MKVSLFFSAAFTALLLFSLNSCKKEDSNAGSGQISFEVTDAPFDDTNIQGVFVTVADVKVDGISADGFSDKQTINLMAYQNGQVKSLANGQFTTGTHANIQLVLDYAQDANGTSPGCYVLTKNGVKHALKASTNASNTISVTGQPVTVSENATTTAVLDFDLRKAIRYGADGSGSAYQFVSDAELNSSVRVVAKSKTGKITGKCSDLAGLAGSKIVVYAYKKGSFTDAEKIPQGSNGILFKNAVTSSACDADGNFTLAFLEEGDFELHFVGYQDANSDNKLEEKGMLSLDVLGNLNLLALNLRAESSVDVQVIVLGVIPL